jgi:hypothetical protein
MQPFPILPPPAPSASASGSNARIEPPHPRLALRLLGACAALLALVGCAGGTAISDTYCRDTFYWRTSARDTEETRRQADLHNSRRLCRCEADCN